MRLASRRWPHGDAGAITRAASGIIVQASYGYHRYQLGLYLNQLLSEDFSFLFFGVFAFFVHALSPNKYLGYFFFVAFFIVNLFIWKPLNIASNLVQFANTPDVTYSDMFGDAPYITAWRWFTLYWLLFCGLLAIATLMFWPRGRQARWAERWRIARRRFSSPLRRPGADLFLIVWCHRWMDLLQHRNLEPSARA